MAGEHGGPSGAGGPRLKPAYLIHGEDHGAIAERRAGLRALAAAQPGGESCLEVLEGDAATPASVAQSLSSMTLASFGAEPGAVGRVIMVEGVERWRDAEVEQSLKPAMREMPPATTLVLFAREEARTKAPGAVHEAVELAGGQVVSHANVKPWELAKWVRERAGRQGLELDAAAAKALVEHVGERPQRLARELEKLALETDAPAEGGASAATAPARRRIEAERIRELAARSSEQRAYELADALVAGERSTATVAYLRLREQGERLSGLTYLMAQRLRDALAISQRLAAGESAAEVRRGLRMPARAAERLIADVARADPERLRVALRALAQLELDTRGGAPLSASRSVNAGLEEDTLAVRTIEAIAGG